MKNSAERALPLLELLYTAPGDPSAWLRFLVALRDAVSGHSEVLFAAQRRGRIPGTLAGSELGILHTALDEVLQPSVPHAPLHDLPVGAVRQLDADKSFGGSRLFQEMLAPRGLRAGPGLVVILERTTSSVISVVLVLPASDSWKPRPRDRALLQILAPHLVTARKLQNALDDRRRYADALVSTFDQLALGVLFLDDNGRVSYANRSAAEMFGLEAGFTDAASLSVTSLDERTRVWRSVLRSVKTEGDEAFVYAHPEDGRPLQVLATPFFWRRGDATAQAHFTRAVFIGDAKARAGDPTGLLRDLFGLTAGEARLALLLVSGCSVSEAASILGVKESTTRSVLRAIFTKTGTNRQADLVRVLLTGPLGGLRERARGAGTGPDRMETGHRSE